MAKTKHRQRIDTTNGSQALKNIQKGTATADMVTGYRSFTHARILSSIADDPQAKEDFKSLPSVKHVVFGTGGDGLPVVLVGHTSLGGHAGRQVWANVSKKSNESAEHGNTSGYWRAFHAPDGSRLSQQSHVDFELHQPFCNLTSATADEFWAVVVFYLVEKGHFGRMAVQPGFTNSLKGACARLANSSAIRAQAISVSDTFSIVENTDVDEIAASEASTEKVSCEAKQLDDMARIKSEMQAVFRIQPKQIVQVSTRIQRDEDELTECRIFVQRIKDKARSKYDTVVASLWERIDEVQANIDMERFRYNDLQKKYSALHLKNETQHNRTKELEKELREHRDWREKMRKMF